MSDAINIYTDGAASGNPGPGGYGVVLTWKSHRREMSGGFRKTTNNRMELLAVIEGLRAIKTPGAEVVIWSDSKYVVDAVEKGWVFGWVLKNFKDKKNEDLWRQYLELHKQFRIKFKWIKGHAGHPENERCDQMAVAASMHPRQADEWYEKNVG